MFLIPYTCLSLFPLFVGSYGWHIINYTKGTVHNVRISSLRKKEDKIMSSMQCRAGQIIQDKQVESAEGKKELREKMVSATMGFPDPTHYSEHCWSQNPQAPQPEV